MASLNTILLPFQAGYENIIMASAKPKKLSVIKRIFENNRYQYSLQLDDSLFSWQGRVSMFAKGVVLCLPFIGHIISVALRFFSASIFLEMLLDFAIKCSAEQQFEIAKWIYTNNPENIPAETRLTLAKILAEDANGLNLLLANLSYLGLETNTAFSLEIIQQKPEVLNQINDSQQLDIAKWIYTNNPENVPAETRLTLAKILTEDADGLNLLLANLSYLDLTEDRTFFSEVIQQKPEVLNQITNPESVEQILDEFIRLDLVKVLNENTKFLENNKKLLAKQLLQKDPEDYTFLTSFFSSLDEDLRKELMKELVLQIKETELPHNPHKRNTAIIHALNKYINKDFTKHLLRDKDINIALADILLSSKESCDLVIENVKYLDLVQNTFFTQKLFQANPIPEQIKQYFAKQLLQQGSKDREFIIKSFTSLNFNTATQEEVIKELLEQMDSFSEEIQIAIAHTIIKKHPRGPSFLLSNITRFAHTKELADLLLEIPNGKTYVEDNSDEFNLLKEL